MTVLGSQPAGDVSHKPGGRLPYFPPSLQLTPQPLIGMLPSLLFGEQRHDGCEQFAQDCYQTASRLQFEPRPSAPESSTLTTRLSSHPCSSVDNILLRLFCDPRLLRPGQLSRPLFTPMSEKPNQMCSRGKPEEDAHRGFVFVSCSKSRRAASRRHILYICHESASRECFMLACRVAITVC